MHVHYGTVSYPIPKQPPLQTMLSYMKWRNIGKPVVWKNEREWTELDMRTAVREGETRRNNIHDEDRSQIIERSYPSGDGRNRRTKRRERREQSGENQKELPNPRWPPMDNRYEKNAYGNRLDRKVIKPHTGRALGRLFRKLGIQKENLLSNLPKFALESKSIFFSYPSGLLWEIKFSDISSQPKRIWEPIQFVTKWISKMDNWLSQYSVASTVFRIFY